MLEQLKNDVVRLREDARKEAELAGAEAETRWDELEVKWTAFQAEIRKVHDSATAKARKMGEELKSSYKRIKEVGE